MIKVALSYSAIDKTPKPSFEALNQGRNWQGKQITLVELANHIEQGYPWMPSLLDKTAARRWQQFCNAAYVLALDIDSGLTIDEALEHPFVKAYCGLAIPSASHTPEHHKFRLVFPLATPLTGYKTIKAAYQYLLSLFPAGDKACKDASRFFYGAKGKQSFLLNEAATLPADFVDRVTEYLANQERQVEQARQRADQYRRERLASGQADHTDELIKLALDTIPADCAYEEWLSVGMALHSHGDDWLTEWDSWSATGSKYRSGDCEKRWRGFRSSNVTIGSLLHIAKQYGFRFPLQASSVANTVNNSGNGLTRLLKKAMGRKRVEIKPDTNVLEIDSGDRAAVIKSAIEQGYKEILDDSGTGSGKSTFAGNLEPSDYGLERAFYFSAEHRNPTVEGIERNYTDMPSRNSGMFAGNSRKTPMGKDFVRHPRKGENSNLPGNCHRADEFHKLYAKGYDIDDVKVPVVSIADGTVYHENPICKTCTMLHQCKRGAGTGYGFKHDRMTALKSPKIRLHPDQFPIDSELGANAVGIWEEAGKLVKSTQTNTAAESDLVAAFDLLEDLPDVLVELLPLKRAFKPLLRGEFTEYYGFDDAKLRAEFLPPVPVDLPELIQKIEGVATGSGGIFTEADRVYADDAAATVQKPTDKLRELDREMKQELADLVVDRSLIESDRQYQVRVEVAKAEIEAQYKAQKQKLLDDYDLAVQSAKDAAKKANRSLRGDAYRETSDRLEQLASNWLIPFLRVWGGLEPGTLRVDRQKLIITRIDDRYRQIAKSLKVNIYMDATQTRTQLAIKRGISPDEILVIRQRQAKVKNLRIVQVRGLGQCGKQRREVLQDRINITLDTLRGIYGNDLAVFDHKKYASATGADGWHFNHTRGSNEFEGKNSIAVVGTAKPNLGMVQDEYQTLTGSLDGFEVYYQHLVDAEIIQTNGRLRANLRQKEKLTIYWLTEDELPPELEAEQIHVSDLTAEALGRGDSMRLKIEQAVTALRQAGKDITQYAIAEFLGISRGTISHYSAWIGLLLESLYNKPIQDSTQDTASNTGENWTDQDKRELAQMLEIVDDFPSFVELALCYPLEVVRSSWEYLSAEFQTRLNGWAEVAT